jgi:hypothetical protein
MSVGPIAIFDKSALQGLSLDEAVLFDNFYLSNITPLFLVETLADLDKRDGKKRPPEHVVGNLAAKTPVGGRPNVHHATLCAGELLEGPLELGLGRPVLAGGRTVATPSQTGITFEPAPEAEALQRWQDGEFLEAERFFARQWRRALSGIDLQAIYETHRPTSSPRLPDLPAAKEAAERLIRRDGNRFGVLKAALDSIRAPIPLRQAVIRRWKDLNGPPLAEFAPYTAHVMTVDLFFNLAIGSDLIGRQRPSNRIDVAYLYYLPFCMVFTSSDRLHERCVPCFLTGRQEFVSGAALKADLAKLDAHYSSLPEDVREQGLMSFAQNPPDGDFLTTRLWDRFLPKWRSNLLKPALPPEAEAKVLELVRQMKKAKELKGDAAAQVTTDSAGFVMLSTRMPASRGKWHILPPHIRNRPPGDEG